MKGLKIILFNLIVALFFIYSFTNSFAQGTIALGHSRNDTAKCFCPCPAPDCIGCLDVSLYGKEDSVFYDIHHLDNKFQLDSANKLLGQLVNVQKNTVLNIDAIEYELYGDTAYSFSGPISATYDLKQHCLQEAKLLFYKLQVAINKIQSLILKYVSKSVY